MACSRSVSIRIDKNREKIWNRFKNWVMLKHGKLHTVLAEETINAIEAYMESKEKPATMQISDKEVLVSLSETLLRKDIASDEKAKIITRLLENKVKKG